MMGTAPRVTVSVGQSEKREAGLQAAVEAPPRAVFPEPEEEGLAEGIGAQGLEPCTGDVEVPQGPQGRLWASGPCLGRVVSRCPQAHALPRGGPCGLGLPSCPRCVP